MRTLLLTTALCSVISLASAQESSDPTVVFGAAATPDGGQNEFLVEQPKDAPNPLGDPLPYAEENNQPTQVGTQADAQSATAENKNSESVPMNLQPNAADVNDGIPNIENMNPQEAAQTLGNDFQNTVTEANGRIYDIQSFPEEDVNVMSNPSEPQSIYSPNVNN